MALRFKTEVVLGEGLVLPGRPVGALLVVGSDSRVVPLPKGPEGYALSVVGGLPAWAELPEIPDSTPTPSSTPTPTPSTTPTASGTPTPSVTPTLSLGFNLWSEGNGISWEWTDAWLLTPYVTNQGRAIYEHHGQEKYARSEGTDDTVVSLHNDLVGAQSGGGAVYQVSDTGGAVTTISSHGAHVYVAGHAGDEDFLVGRIYPPE